MNLRRTIAAAIVALFAATTLYAQTPQRPGGQFAQMREKHKYTFQLMTKVRKIGQINKDPRYTLTPAQAKKTLAVLQPLRSKPKLTQDQAKQALKQLNPIFTVSQLNAMARIKSPQRRPGQGGMGMGRPGDGSGRPGGPGGPGRPGGMRRMDPNAMKDFNPFYSKPASGDQFSQMRVKRMNVFFSDMQASAKGKNSKPATAPKKPQRK